MFGAEQLVMYLTDPLTDKNQQQYGKQYQVSCLSHGRRMVQ